MRREREKKPLKLFYWRAVDALANYGAGHAFALATSKAAAIKLVVSAHVRERFWRGGQPELDEEDLIRLSELTRELQEKEPKVFARPTGFAMMGSE